ncbi:MAG: hypothetical protein ACXW18_02035, partial [Pyrinomonadaceae bacterium]
MFATLPRSLKPIVPLTFSILFAAIIFWMLPAQAGSQKQKLRSIQIKNYKNPPLEITAVNVKGEPIQPGRKIAADSDWFTGMTVTIKNLSEKPIVFATVLVMARHQKNGVPTQVNGRDIYANFELTFGELPPAPGESPRSNRVTSLMPGQSTDLAIDERMRELFYTRLRGRNSSTDVPELALSVNDVAFEGNDNMMWMHGFWRQRDPQDPLRWRTVDEPRRRNHALMKPKFLRVAFLPNSSILSSHFEEPPRCTYRDIGPVPAPCTAYNIGENVHCTWENDQLTNRTPKNAVAGVQIEKYCFGSHEGTAC